MYMSADLISCSDENLGQTACIYITQHGFSLPACQLIVIMCFYRNKGRKSQRQMLIRGYRNGNSNPKTQMQQTIPTNTQFPMPFPPTKHPSMANTHSAFWMSLLAANSQVFIAP